MGISAGVFDTRINLAEQTRESILVTRVPKAPLFTLVALNCVYCVLGLVLAFMALASHPADVNDVRERLSIAGLTAFCFEGTRAKKPAEKKRQMFSEHEGTGSSRVGVERSGYEGWEYTVRQGLPKNVE